MQYRVINPDLAENYDLAVDVIFKNRGVENYKPLLRITDDYVCSPFLLDNIEEGAELLLSHIRKNNKIFLQIDPDVDGYTSASILTLYLQDNFDINLQYNVYEGRKRGVVPADVPNDAKLVIIPDAGTNQYQAHKELKDRGIDVLVIDHHEGEYSDNATVINNKLSSMYANKELSGAGVAYKFCKVLDSKIGVNKADNYLDLVALGLIADMMDLRSLETNYYVQTGLKQIRSPLFKRMVEKQSYSIGKEITPIGIAFYIAPLINAMTRVGTEEEKILLFRGFTENDKPVPSTKRGAKEGETEMLTEQIFRLCNNARNRQNKMIEPVKQRVDEIIEEEGLADNAILTVDITGMLDREFVGLCANQIANKYKRPCLLLIKDEKEEEYSGSGRDYGNSGMTSFRDFLKDTEMFNFVEGHDGAFGAALPINTLEDFVDYSNEKIGKDVFEEIYDVDFVENAEDIPYSLIITIDKLKFLWGQGLPEPLILIKEVPCNEENIRIMGRNEDTIKISHNGIDYMFFKASDDTIEKIKPQENTTKKLQIVGRAKLNYWNRNVAYQIVVKDFVVTEEILNDWAF